MISDIKKILQWLSVQKSDVKDKNRENITSEIINSCLMKLHLLGYAGHV